MTNMITDILLTISVILSVRYSITLWARFIRNHMNRQQASYEKIVSEIVAYETREKERNER